MRIVGDTADAFSLDLSRSNRRAVERVIPPGRAVPAVAVGGVAGPDRGPAPMTPLITDHRRPDGPQR